MFIHIRPEEAKTIARIPRALLFAAPGLPKGHVLMGFDEKGQCPMLLGGECSIYDDRPQTCRDYDCRVFAATGIAVDSETQPEIAERVRAWEFSYESEDGRKKQRLVKEAAAFLQEKRDLFPHGSLPTYPVQLAAVAVEVYEVFNDARTWTKQEAGTWADGAIAQAILAALSEGPADSVADAAATRSGRKRSSSGV
jgi:Fe-S-cluster containining protein